ncbi:MAG TPA: twin-arginine translocase TatA/TatE family subunit [Bryobacteraceae bacterium]|jgi:sec-independent protein translocase protein TatA|nr:twin-arginine translocase TatA/TatE family subunit [Bryobacteraceae bacterium]
MIDGLLQPTHLLLILVVALFIFGPKKLPELGQGLGKGIRGFRDAMKAASEEPQKVDSPAQTTTSTAENAK